ncbi:7178_t:CDS:2, partial [Dentiscutata erythropus]
WTRGYSSNNDVSYTNKSSKLSELSDKIVNKFIQPQMDLLQRTMMSLVERRDKEFLSLVEEYKKELLSLTESNKKELLSLIESNKKEILSLMESNKKKLLSLTKSKNNKFYEIKKLAEDRAISLLYMRDMCNIKGALELIRTQIRALIHLFQDEDFIKILKKACEDNDLWYDDIQNCIRGLYYSASKQFYRREYQVVIDSQSWSSNE